MIAFVVVITGTSSGITATSPPRLNLARKPHSKTGQAFHVVLVSLPWR
jgi:hypothetical protein